VRCGCMLGMTGGSMDNPFGLTAPQWLRAGILGVLMAVVYLVVVVGADVYRAFR